MKIYKLKYGTIGFVDQDQERNEFFAQYPVFILKRMDIARYRAIPFQFIKQDNPSEYYDLVGAFRHGNALTMADGKLITQLEEFGDFTPAQ